MRIDKLKNLQPAEPVRRNKRAQPGDMLNVDTNQLARFEWGGNRITSERRVGCSRDTGYEKADVAIDNDKRLKMYKMPPDEKQAITVGFLLRVVACFDGQGKRNAEASG